MLRRQEEQPSPSNNNVRKIILGGRSPTKSTCSFVLILVGCGIFYFHFQLLLQRYMILQADLSLSVSNTQKENAQDLLQLKQTIRDLRQELKHQKQQQTQLVNNVTVILDQDNARQHNLKTVKETSKESIHDNSNNNSSKDKLFAFTIRDARRPVPTTYPRDLHVYDYVDLTVMAQSDQLASQNSQLFLSGHVVGAAPCQAYSLLCYQQKITQVFEHALRQPQQYPYFFFMEADNELCISVQELEFLVWREQRYFIATGIGASGWLMSRQFILDFLPHYKRLNQHRKPIDQVGPDVIASHLLQRAQSWAVTRQYFVSHSIVTTTVSGNNRTSSQALTLKDNDNQKDNNNNTAKNVKHLPRCFEPHRSKWHVDCKEGGALGDQFGWDFFDFDACPAAEIFPCQEGQLQAIADARTLKCRYEQKQRPPQPGYRNISATQRREMLRKEKEW